MGGWRWIEADHEYEASRVVDALVALALGRNGFAGIGTQNDDLSLAPNFADERLHVPKQNPSTSTLQLQLQQLPTYNLLLH